MTLCCRAAVCSAAALQGRCTAAPLHCRSGVQQGMHGVNDTPAQAKKGEVNANVNSIILKSLPNFGKLFRIIEFTFAFTSLFFACAGVLFAPQTLALLRCSLAASSPCRYSPVALQRSSRTVLQFCCNANRQPNNPVLAQVAIQTL